MNGHLAVIGAKEEGADDNGAAYVFVRSGTTWSEEQKLLASDGARNDSFGESVFGKGDVAVVGARLDDDAGTDSGSAYLFTRTGTTWTAR